MVGVKHRESEEHGEIKVGVGGVARYKAADNGQYHAHKIVDVKFELAPLLFQRASYHPVYIKAEYNENYACVVGNYSPGYYPPPFSSQNPASVKKQEIGQRHIR